MMKTSEEQGTLQMVDLFYLCFLPSSAGVATQTSPDKSIPRSPPGPPGPLPRTPPSLPSSPDPLNGPRGP